MPTTRARRPTSAACAVGPFLRAYGRQDWEVVREEKGTHNLLDPTYPDAKVGGIRRWAAVCRGCQLAEIVATLFPEGIV